jgi:dTDP-4-dehydrorhamnose reductase
VKIVVLGNTGMLGSAVSSYFINKYGEENVLLSYRKNNIKLKNNMFYLDALEFDEKESSIPECDYIINCIGLIKQVADWNTYEAIKINSCFPRELGKYCNKHNIKLINITTDCVFSGKDGNYNENSIHDALDEYGKTKSLGEVDSKNVMNIRTSVIGEELYKNISLISWVKSQNGKRVNGYTNHLWNGVTTLQYAKICSKIIDEELFEEGLFHVFSNTVNKNKLIRIIADYFKLDIIIDPFETEKSCDRSLSTVKELNNKLDIPSIKDQIRDM